MQDAKRATRRRHDSDLKSRVLAECAVAGASVAQVALAHGLNANLVHNWRRLAAHDRAELVAPPSPPSFVPVSLPTMTATAHRDIRVELRRGALAVNIIWPLTSSAEFSAWLCELLR